MEHGEMRMLFLRICYCIIFSVYDNRPMQYIGCYVDDNNRDMGNTWTIVSTIAQCAAQCTKRYIGLQGGSACFCSDVYNRAPVYRKVLDAECGGEIGSSKGARWRSAVLIIDSLLINFLGLYES